MVDIVNYETLLVVGREQKEPQRFLFTFLKASLPKDHEGDEEQRFQSGSGGVLQPIMCVDKALDDLTNFADLVEESENIMNCSYDIVYVQSLPTSSGSVSGTSTITTIFSGSISPHSQRGLLGQNGSLSISYRNLDLNKTYISYPTTTTHNYKPQCDGSYKITASIHDGNYTKSKVLGYVDYTGGSSCGTPS